MAMAFCKRARTSPLLRALGLFMAAPDASSAPAFCSSGMICQDFNPGPTGSCSLWSVSSSNGHAVRLAFQRKWFMEHSSFQPGLRLGHSYGVQIRRMSAETKSQKKTAKKKKKKKKTKRGIIKKLKHLRYITNIKKKTMDPEQKLMARIERAKKRIDELQALLKKLELPPSPTPEHDPESLTAEELHYLKRLSYKQNNYLIIGVRGVFGGVILNMHLHWKRHQLVKVRCKNFTEDEIRETGEELARLSGGVVVDIQEGHTIVMYRGKNYTRPEDIIPKNTLTKRKALFKARYEQALESTTKNLEAVQEELKLYREYKAREAAGLQSEEEVCKKEEASVESYTNSWSDSEEVDVDSAFVCDSDSVLETESGWSSGSEEVDNNSTYVRDSDSDPDSDLASYSVGSDIAKAS